MWKRSFVSHSTIPLVFRYIDGAKMSAEIRRKRVPRSRFFLEPTRPRGVNPDLSRTAARVTVLSCRARLLLEFGVRNYSALTPWGFRTPGPLSSEGGFFLQLFVRTNRNKAISPHCEVSCLG